MPQGYKQVASNPDVHVMKGVSTSMKSKGKIAPDAAFKRKQLTYSNIKH